MAEISPLRRRMIEDMTIRNLSPATQRSYISAVRKFSRYFARSPDRLDLGDIHAFQVHLVSTGISWASLNQIVCALRFFYGITLGQDDVPERIPYAREPRKLPVILSADEVVQFLEAVSSLKARVALTTAYVRISMNRDSDFGKSRTSISLSRGQRARSSSASLVAVMGD
jgi:integrase/recombinase XerD